MHSLEPIRTSNNFFANFSMRERLPEILDRTLMNNPDYPVQMVDAVRKLRDNIRSNAALPPLQGPAPDAEEWAADFALRAGETWLNTQWLFAECYAYRCLVQATRYWETRRDPFVAVKREELTHRALWENLEASLEPIVDQEQLLYTLLSKVLWGNRADLSYPVAGQFGALGAPSDLLVDDRAWAISCLLKPHQNIHWIADNTGRELAADLTLIAAVLNAPGTRVTIHLKAHPTFVSDAILEDYWQFLAACTQQNTEVRAFAHKIQTYFYTGRLHLVADAYWNSARFLWARPSRIAALLDSADLVILKGDANYRRAVGDALFPPGFPFSLT